MTLNAEPYADRLLAAIESQDKQPHEILVIDSSSSDGTVEKFSSAGKRVHVIPRNEFDHGGTRQMAVNLVSEAEIIIFITQDAVFLNSGAIRSLLECFKDVRIGAAYGRHISPPNASPIESHARLFNYPARSRVKSKIDSTQLGLKAAYLSNCFAAYRRACLTAVGGFPTTIIFGEDMYVGGKMLLSGWNIMYCAEAMIYHSHDYGFLKEFRRNFDIGVFHARQPWLRTSMGNAEAEGWRFVVDQMRHLSKVNPWLIPSAVLRDALKFVGYRLGLLEKIFPRNYKARLGMNKAYWVKN